MEDLLIICPELFSKIIDFISIIVENWLVRKIKALIFDKFDTYHIENDGPKSD
jgi:hypothetical protein